MSARGAVGRPQGGQAGSAATPVYGRVAVCLAVLWLAVPAVQYVGAAARTAMLFGEGGGPGEAFAALDLAPVYATLLVCTLVLAGLRHRAAREDVP